jgi:nitroimidazol reductase NimA-like FMN-containing flavoprotein (pyridoxamine 5'-phosphate oxidase superfamily)
MMTNLSDKECKELLANNYLGNIAYISGESPYMVPMTYYFDGDHTVIGYSSEGHKTDAMRKNNRVSLHVMELRDINNWTSVLAHGKYEELGDGDAKAYLRQFAGGIKDLILRKEEKNLQFISDFSSKSYKGELPIVFKITLDDISGKLRVH